MQQPWGWAGRLPSPFFSSCCHANDDGCGAACVTATSNGARTVAKQPSFRWRNVWPVAYTSLCGNSFPEIVAVDRCLLPHLRKAAGVLGRRAARHEMPARQIIVTEVWSPSQISIQTSLEFCILKGECHLPYTKTHRPSTCVNSPVIP